MKAETGRAVSFVIAGDSKIKVVCEGCGAQIAVGVDHARVPVVVRQALQHVCTPAFLASSN